MDYIINKHYFHARRNNRIADIFGERERVFWTVFGYSFPNDDIVRFTCTDSSIDFWYRSGNNLIMIHYDGKYFDSKVIENVYSKLTQHQFDVMYRCIFGG